ncbi:Uncharacterized protein dnm_069560 [Desulfonema magnum]|uniref:Uncharacterized protein n=1 Tax=Desulfonema magnum TaxID=45655 RepID=A0A975BTD0_9BACT|nr:Uncharacterized protein dnm_069560 [Desulfonema magnum]
METSHGQGRKKEKFLNMDTPKVSTFGNKFPYTDTHTTGQKIITY